MLILHRPLAVFGGVSLSRFATRSRNCSSRPRGSERVSPCRHRAAALSRYYPLDRLYALTLCYRPVRQETAASPATTPHDMLIAGPANSAGRRRGCPRQPATALQVGGAPLLPSDKLHRQPPPIRGSDDRHGSRLRPHTARSAVILNHCLAMQCPPVTEHCRCAIYPLLVGQRRIAQRAPARQRRNAQDIEYPSNKLALRH